VKENKKSIFEKLEGFFAAFDQITKVGFFSNLKVETQSIGDRYWLMIRGTAYLPDDKKDLQIGVKPFVDPRQLMSVIKQQFKACKFATHVAEVKYEQWSEWDKAGENVIGSLGSRVTFDLVLS
jgi:hypothetical protein